MAAAKHLPPSAATLRLLDVGGAAGATLSAQRGDLSLQVVPTDPAVWSAADDSIDAVVAYGQALNADFLARSLAALRPGGRLIIVNPDDRPDEQHVKTLEQAGYIRILVEAAVEQDGRAFGALLRGEKAHLTADTHERIQAVAQQDAAFTDLATYRGRYLHLLIQQQPNKPAWKLDPGETVTWHAVAVTVNGETALLAFSSLPNAVGFMQPAVLSGQIRDVNKVGKFSRTSAQTWTLPVILNADVSLLAAATVTLVAVDPTSAEAPDE